jgi:hypothetical protein
MMTSPGRLIRDGRVEHKDKWEIEVWVEKADGNEVLLNFDSEDTPNPQQFKWKSETRIDGRIRTGAMDVDSLQLPLPPGMDPYELIRPKEGGDTESERSTKFAWQADMYVTIDLSNIKDQTAVCGGPFPSAPSKLPTITIQRPFGGNIPSDLTKCQIFPFRWEAFFDWAQMKWVDVADVDVVALRTWVNANAGNATRVIYVEIKPGSVVSAATTNKSNDSGYWPALRLRNGSRLPGPLTVGSMYPLYMQGNYNNVNKQPAAVFGDRLTGLSQCWFDSPSPNSDPPDWRSRPACNTYQYFSIITGESEGYLGCYHHGSDPGCQPIPSDKSLSVTVQNLEDWRDGCGWNDGLERCEYRIIGSFVTFWSPKIASKWGNDPNPDQHYSAPYRNWSFDYDLSDPQKLPPATPNVGYVLRASFREMY